MIVIPAIDIQNKQCVRLQQGDFTRKTVFDNNPLNVALHWEQKKAERLHIVDLDGALHASPVHKSLITEIIKQVNIDVQVGGGIRNLDTIQYYLDAGASAVILGTAAVKNLDLVSAAVTRFPNAVIVGIDAHAQLVASEGWTEDSGCDVLKLVDSVHALDIHSIIYTDIAKDGMLGGVNFAMLQTILTASSKPVIASGGVSCLKDIIALQKLQSPNLYGVIVGRALYDERLELQQAMQITRHI